MTELIRTWPDALFYYSAASTANVREQLIKLQQANKLLRALSDASTVDTNGDKLQDILTGLSLGNLSQRHKYRVLYDTVNDRFVVQRNSGTDASKTWVELLRVSAAGALTTTGAITAAGGLTTTGGGITMGGNLDMNQFYLRNVEKINGRTRTDSLLVHEHAKLRGTLQVGRSSLFSGASAFYGDVSFDGANFQVGTTAAKVLDYVYAQTDLGNQAIPQSTETDVTQLTGLTLPNSSTNLTSRKYLVRFNMELVDTGGLTPLYVVNVYNGPNGNKSDSLIYQVPDTGFAISQKIISGQKVFTPGASNRTKIGISVTSNGSDTEVAGNGTQTSTIFIQELKV